MFYQHARQLKCALFNKKFTCHKRISMGLSLPMKIQLLILIFLNLNVLKR